MMLPVLTRMMCMSVTAAVLAAGANVSAQEPGEGQQPAAPLNTIAEVFAALEACWIPPGLEQARAGMQITVMLSFKRNGELLGKPRITYETPGASDDERMSYRVAMAQALRRCTPLRFTDALGGALAGRPLTMRFIDNRKLKQAGTTDGREA
ncbi:MAG TPA: hypothetical protein VG291_02445 [Xanthobacteraceae bacterium]|nr:hypothetical protein [Xanthobacteraceae bacterium]